MDGRNEVEPGRPVCPAGGIFAVVPDSTHVSALRVSASQPPYQSQIRRQHLRRLRRAVVQEASLSQRLSRDPRVEREIQPDRRGQEVPPPEPHPWHERPTSHAGLADVLWRDHQKFVPQAEPHQELVIVTGVERNPQLVAEQGGQARDGRLVGRVEVLPSCFETNALCALTEYRS